MKVLSPNAHKTGHLDGDYTQKSDYEIDRIDDALTNILKCRGTQLCTSSFRRVSMSASIILERHFHYFLGVDNYCWHGGFGYGDSVSKSNYIGMSFVFPFYNIMVCESVLKTSDIWHPYILFYLYIEGTASLESTCFCVTIIMMATA